MIPGARLIPMRNGSQAALRFNRAQMGGRDCPPQYWVDGVKAYGLNIDDIIPQDVEGIEIYEGACDCTCPVQHEGRERRFAVSFSSGRAFQGRRRVPAPPYIELGGSRSGLHGPTDRRSRPLRARYRTGTTGSLPSASRTCARCCLV